MKLREGVKWIKIDIMAPDMSDATPDTTLREHVKMHKSSEGTKHVQCNAGQCTRYIVSMVDNEKTPMTS
jgi:xanthine dehydrogenase iron-sulfur cluster and FAD-binding subunit A